MNSPRRKSPLSQEILAIADALAYKKLERLREAEHVTDQILLDILKLSVTEPYAILFFPGRCFQITPFGMKLAMTLPEKGANYLIAFPDLDEKFLRQAFTGFELVVYKTCHIVLEDQRATYQWETESTRQRFRRLKPLLLLSVSDWTAFTKLFDGIFFVRDAFAHSFVELAEIKYYGMPLDMCFGDSYLGHTRRDAKSFGARIFTDDLRELFEPVMKLFTQHQLKQIDTNKFYKLCDRLLAKRSLAP